MTGQPPQHSPARTITAYERTLLAEERTYSAWSRTGLASVATGFAIVRLMTEADPKWLVRTLGIMFIVAGGMMFALGYWTYRAALQEVPETPIRGAPPWIIGVLSIGLILAAAAALALVFLDW
jgi:putative membrane protein